MKELEDKLNAAKEEYESLRYPDDLAAQVLTRQRPSRWRWALAVAAAIILLMFIAPHANGPDPSGADKNVAGGEAFVYIPQDVPALPNVSLGDVPLAAAASISGLYQNMLSLVSDFDKIILDEVKLDDLYKDAEQTEKGLKQLERLILNQPGA